MPIVSSLKEISIYMCAYGIYIRIFAIIKEGDYMTGTIVNTLAILAGSIVGLFLTKGIKKSYQESLMNILGLIVIVMGIENAIGSNDMLLIITSLVLGTLIGEMIGIEDKLDKLGMFLQSKFGKNDSNISIAFVSTSLIYCVGALAILGALESGITGTHDTLYTKSILDGISSIIFASTLGIGVVFSAFSVLIYQGSITLLAVYLTPLFTPVLISQISAIGGIMIIAIGINVLEIKRFKVGNMLPAILIPIIYFIITNIL